jgi:hypothetical protein
MALLARTNGLSATAPLRAASRAQRVVRVRAAEGETTPAAPVAPAPAAAPAQVPAPASPAPAAYVAGGASATPAMAAAGPVGFFDAMKISAPARVNVPFAVNGRLAQLGIVAGIGCEFFTHESIVQQFQAHSAFVLALSAVIAAASFAPVLRGAPADEAFGPLTPRAERFNSEAALIGFAALLIIEGVKGAALF